MTHTQAAGRGEGFLNRE